MQYVEKGTTLKGITIGDYIDGHMVVGIDHDYETCLWDVAVLYDEPTNASTMSQSNELYPVSGLKEYEHSENVEWISSETYKSAL